MIDDILKNTKIDPEPYGLFFWQNLTICEFY
jgi:hypothetical protein